MFSKRHSENTNTMSTDRVHQGTTHSLSYMKPEQSLHKNTPVTYFLSFFPFTVKSLLYKVTNSLQERRTYNMATEASNVVVDWLFNVPATCECIKGTDLLRQFYVLPH